MIPAPIPENELERLAALYEYNVLDTMAEKDYDDITRIAADICDMPISLISLIDKNRQWFKSRFGFEPIESHRDLAFCAHAILQPDEIFIVKDSSKDERFHDNPLVTGDANVAFYAGVPLVDEDGHALGSLCVIDNKPNSISKAQEQTLKALARQVVAYLEIRKKTQQLAAQKTALEQVNTDLTRFAYVVAHDIKSPCNSLAMGVDYLKQNYAAVLDADAQEIIAMMEETSRTAINMVEGILQHTLTVNKTNVEREEIIFHTLVSELRTLIDLPPGFTLHVEGPMQKIHGPRFLLLQVLQNLCTNAIKYNDKEHGQITVSATDTNAGYTFSVKDNGPGIALADQARIFDLFCTLGVPDRYARMGTGIGLSTVKRIVSNLGGEINVYSQPGQGSIFIFTISK